MLLTKPKFAHHFDFCPVTSDLQDLEGGDVLLCIFGPVVPVSILKRYNQAYNVHPGPITYPGRDPHHWALYESAQWFGVTLHEMTKHVDQGTVIRTDPFLIETDDPQVLKNQTNTRAIAMMKKFGPKLLNGTYIFSPMAEDWAGKARKRQCLIDLVGNGLPKKARRAFRGFV